MDKTKRKISLSRECSDRLDEEMKRTGVSRSSIVEESLKEYFSMGSEIKDHIRHETKIILCHSICEITEGTNLIKKKKTEQGVKKIESEIKKLCQIL
ncbi:ribbon-helix-helix protein, CopG family [Blautia producta]|uniref:ribbon-helix-helix protein, CopG family n=1 Tax=Blautia producta TaxID=33035 RepID=UPI0031B58A32